MRSLMLLLASSLCACTSNSPGTDHGSGLARSATAGTASTAGAAAAPTSDWAATPIGRSTSVVTSDGEPVSLDELLDRLAEADAVFLGETHLDETTHRFEHAVYEGLLERRDGKVVLAMEMFERDVQPSLDAYLAGDIDEETFLAESRPWTNYRAAYRPLVERAKASGRPIVASNFPVALRREIAQKGLSVLDEIPSEERWVAPLEILPNTRAYRRRTDNAVRGHLGMMGGPRGLDDERLTSTQTLWDNSMGEACALALARYPGSAVLHVNGGFHTAYHDGTARQFALRAPDAKAVTIAILPSASFATDTLTRVPEADFVVFTERGARDLSGKDHAVYAQTRIDYRLHLPDGATDGAPVPLLLWLSDDGLRAQDGLDLLVSRFGDECAIASFDPPYREELPDLSSGGRWYWSERFNDDVSTLASVIDEACGYLVRSYPIDPARICLAGEGTGATVVAASALGTQRDLRAVSLAPRSFARIGDIPLPLPETRLAPPSASLHVLARADDEAWWRGELEGYSEIGLDNQLTVASDDPWSVELERERALRSALGLRDVAEPAHEQRAHVVVPIDSPRARHWARMQAARHATEQAARVAVLDPETPIADGSLALPTALDRDALARGEGLPRCPGPFGGTTVLVVPDDDLDAWLALEEADPLNAKSRFHRLRIATSSGERALVDVLTQLEAEHRTNVLITPAAFAAEGAEMRALRTSLGSLADRLELHWSPGLGGG